VGLASPKLTLRRSEGDTPRSTRHDGIGVDTQRAALVGPDFGAVEVEVDVGVGAELLAESEHGNRLSTVSAE